MASGWDAAEGAQRKEGRVMDRTLVNLIDKLDWRIKTLKHLELYATNTDIGRANQEEVLDCIGMMILELQQILDEHSKRPEGSEGPLGPLPPGLMDGKEG